MEVSSQSITTLQKILQQVAQNTTTKTSGVRPLRTAQLTFVACIKYFILL